MTLVLLLAITYAITMIRRCAWCNTNIAKYRGDAKVCSHRCRQAVYMDVTRTKRDAVTRHVCMVHGVPLDGRGRCLAKGCEYVVLRLRGSGRSA